MPALLCMDDHILEHVEVIYTTWFPICPSVQVALSRLGCTEQPGSPTLSRPTPAVVQAMGDEYLGSHPYYK